MSTRYAWLLAWSVCFGLLRADPLPQGPAVPALPDQDAPPLLRVPIVPAKKPAAPPIPPAPEVPVKKEAATPPTKPAPQAPAAAEAAPAQATLAPTASIAPKITSSTSTSKQFTVYGGDLGLRNDFCILCEDTAAALGGVLKDNGQFVLPIHVVLKTPPDVTATGPAVTLNIDELTHGGFHLQINAQLRTGFRPPDFTRELVCVLLAERILRNHEKLSTTRQRLPAWVMTGVSQAMEYRSRSRPSALFSAVFRRGQVYTLDHILTADPAQLDALSRGIYETSTCALVLTLIDQPDGPVRFTRFLNALAVESKPDRDLLTQYFPNLAASKSALEKWWSLQMAALATPTAMESLGVAQTEDELDTALMLLLPGARKQAEEPAKPQAQGEEPVEKKAGGIFGWLKRDSKEEAIPAEKTEPKNEPKPEVDRKKQSQTKGTEQGNALSLAESLGMASLPLYFTSEILASFDGGRSIAFPFKKKPKVEEETVDTAKEKDPKKPETSAETKKPGAAPESAKPAKPEPAAAPAKPKTEEAIPSLSRKPGQSRSIGSRPNDLPKAPPVVADKAEKPPADATAKKVDEPKKPEEPKAEDAAPDKSGRPTRFNWFRKNPAPDEKPEDTKPPAPKPAPKTEPKPETPSVARKPASPPAPEKRATKPGTIPLEDFALIAKRSDRSEILNRCINRLNALKLRAHPLYKPLIAEYTAVVQDLVQGKTKGASTKLENLRHQREAIHEKAVAVETHLDWYEANHTGTLSHAFDDYLRLDDELGKERLPRNDALSKYLDAVQKEFQDR